MKEREIIEETKKQKTKNGNIINGQSQIEIVMFIIEIHNMYRVANNNQKYHSIVSSTLEKRARWLHSTVAMSEHFQP